MKRYNRTSIAVAVMVFLLALELLFAPVFRGGNRALPLLILELIALLLAFITLLNADFKQHLTKWQILLFTAILVLPLIQLLPLPTALWGLLPGRDFYAQPLQQLFTVTEMPSLRMMAMVPFETEAAWLATLPALFVFLAAIGLPGRQLWILFWLFLLMATAQAGLAILQLNNDLDSVFRLGNKPSDGFSPTGTYVNRNHLAGLLLMALPPALTLFTVYLRAAAKSPTKARGWLLGGLFFMLGLLLCIVIFFTRSRMAVLLLVVSLILVVIMLRPVFPGTKTMRWFWVLGAGTLAIIIMFDAVPILQRILLNSISGDARWPIFSATWQAALAFFPLGSGAGSFAEIFQRFQPSQITGFVNHAHNDYVDTFLELGLLYGIVGLALLYAFFRRWLQLWPTPSSTDFELLQAAAGASMLLMILFSLVEFQFRIPANYIYFAFLAAILWHQHGLPDTKTQQSSAKNRDGIKHRHNNKTQKAPDRHKPTATIPPENEINPFDT